MTCFCDVLILVFQVSFRLSPRCATLNNTLRPWSPAKLALLLYMLSSAASCTITVVVMSLHRLLAQRGGLSKLSAMRSQCPDYSLLLPLYHM